MNIGTGNLVKYTYDILGRRTKKIDYSKSSTNPESTIYVYSGDNILSDYKTYGILVNGTGTLTPITLKKNYINSIGTDGILAYDAEEQISPTGTGKTTNRYYYHTNQLGSVTALTNSTGAIMQTYSYDAFGKAYVRNGSGTGITLISLDTYTGATYSNSRLYTGREYDKEIGMYYLRARYYNANTGKFISRDPIGQNDQVNLYTYVANSPLKYTDRNGKEKKFVAAYDDYNAIKAKIYNSNGSFDMSFINMDTDDQMKLWDQYYTKRDYARELHYARNRMNINLPTNTKQAEELGWSTVIASYHQNNVSEGEGLNVKYVPGDGKREVVFDYQGNTVVDNEDMGTYNFFSPISNKIRHIQYDVKPWEEWGNNSNDSTTYDQRKQIYTGLF